MSRLAVAKRYDRYESSCIGYSLRSESVLTVVNDARLRLKAEIAQEGEVYAKMKSDRQDKTHESYWFAIRTQQDFTVERILKDKCDEVFFPKEIVSTPGKKTVVKAAIPHVLFIRTTHDNARDLETFSRNHPEQSIPFWIYRYPKDDEIQIIPQTSINLLRLLTADDASQCRIYTGREFKPKERVRVIGGPYKGYEGYVQRVRKNKHVIVKIEGVCMVILPFIHPDLLQPVSDNDGLTE